MFAISFIAFLLVAFAVVCESAYGQTTEPTIGNGSEIWVVDRVEKLDSLNGVAVFITDSDSLHQFIAPISTFTQGDVYEVTPERTMLNRPDIRHYRITKALETLHRLQRRDNVEISNEVKFSTKIAQGNDSPNGLGLMLSLIAVAFGTTIRVRVDESKTPYGQDLEAYAFAKAIESLSGGITAEGISFEGLRIRFDSEPVDVEAERQAQLDFDVAGMVDRFDTNFTPTKKVIPLEERNSKKIVLSDFDIGMKIIESKRTNNPTNDNPTNDNPTNDNPTNNGHSFRVMLKNQVTGKIRKLESNIYSTNNDRVASAIEVAETVYNRLRRLVADKSAGSNWVVMLNADVVKGQGYVGEFEIDNDLLNMHRQGIDVTPLLSLNGLIG